MNKYQLVKDEQKKHRTAYMKTKDKGDKAKASILTTLIGDINTKAKSNGTDLDQISDDFVFKCINSLLKSINENINSGNLADDQLNKYQLEKEILESFLPNQLTEQELGETIDQIIEENNVEGQQGIGVVMGQLSKKFPNQFDGKTAKNIVTEKLS